MQCSKKSLIICKKYQMYKDILEYDEDIVTSQIIFSIVYKNCSWLQYIFEHKEISLELYTKAATYSISIAPLYILDLIDIYCKKNHKCNVDVGNGIMYLLQIQKFDEIKTILEKPYSYNTDQITHWTGFYNTDLVHYMKKFYNDSGDDNLSLEHYYYSVMFGIAGSGNITRYQEFENLYSYAVEDYSGFYNTAVRNCHYDMAKYISRNFTTEQYLGVFLTCCNNMLQLPIGFSYIIQDCYDHGVTQYIMETILDDNEWDLNDVTSQYVYELYTFVQKRNENLINHEMQIMLAVVFDEVEILTQVIDIEDKEELIWILKYAKADDSPQIVEYLIDLGVGA